MARAATMRRGFWGGREYCFELEHGRDARWSTAAARRLCRRDPGRSSSCARQRRAAAGHGQQQAALAIALSMSPRSGRQQHASLPAAIVDAVVETVPASGRRRPSRECLTGLV